MGIIVETNYGKLEGFKEDGVNKWLGVPYAKPPIDKLRFKRAVECESWKGVCETKKYRNKPYQFMDRKGTNIPEREDCLYMNIWAPEDAKKSPVFVWIYGGAYAVGEGSDPAYDGTNFAKEGIIYINFNYRLGVLGFYDFTMYDKSFDSNCGVSDQITALKWIKENIEVFGGDSNNITIAGESAGGGSVINMFAAPKAKGLFNKAIAQSPVPGCIVSHNIAKLNTNIYLEHLGIKPDEVWKLKTMNLNHMKESAIYVRCNTNKYPGMYIPGPVLDDLIPELPWKAVAKGSSEGIKLIIGTNHDEATLFVNKKKNVFPNGWNEIEEMLKINNCVAKLPALQKLYDKLPHEQQMQEFQKDKSFLIDSIKMADVHSIKSDTWMYRFDYAPAVAKSAGYGAPHTVEINIALNTMGKGWFSMFWNETPKNIIDDLIKSMHTAWLNFVKTGNPNGHLNIKWEKYNPTNRATFIFDKENKLEFDPAKKSYEIWKDIELYRNI